MRVFILALTNFVTLPIIFTFFFRKVLKCKKPRLMGYFIGLTVAFLWFIAFPKISWIYNPVLELIESEETIYSPGYNESNFKKIRKNMSSNEVLSLLGEPIDRIKLSENEEVWRYTEQGPHNTNYRERNVVFCNSKVIEIDDSFYID